MRNRPQAIMCLLILLGTASAQFPNGEWYNYYSNRTYYCLDEGIIVWDRNYTFQDLDILRNSRSNNLKKYFHEIFAYIKSKDTKYLISATGSYGPLLITMMAISFVSLLMILIWTFGVCKKVHNRCLEEFTTVWACVLFWCYIGLWVTIIVYVALSIYWGVQAFCSYMAVPELLYYGDRRIANTTNRFMGMQIAGMSIGNFTLESLNYTGTAAHDVAYKSIINANLPLSYSNLILSLQNFYNVYARAKIINADGGEHISRTIHPFYYPFIDQRIQFDTEIMGNATIRLNRAAEVLLSYGTANTPAIKSLSTLRTQMVLVTREYYTFLAGWAFAWEYFMNGLIRNKSFGQTGIWVMFSFITANAFLLMVIMMIVFCICCYRKCLGCVCFAKFLLVLVALLTIGVFIDALIILFGGVVVSGHCFYLSQVNVPFPNSTIIQDVGITINEPTRVIWRKCIDVNEDPSVLEATPTTPSNNEYYGDAVAILDGLTAYPTYVHYFGENQFSGYSYVSGNWTRTLIGETVDFNDVDGNLSIMNQAIMCGGTIYAIKPPGCPGWEGFTCLSIADEGTINIPSCTATANITVVQNIFNNLKLYAVSMTSVYTRMINDFSSPNPSYGGQVGGPWYQFNKTGQLIEAQAAHYNVIRNSFPNTARLANTYNYTFSELTNCSAIRKELVKSEGVSCFYGDYSLYTLLILSIVAGMILFILEWCICGALREQDNIVYAAPVAGKTPILLSQPTVLVNNTMAAPAPTIIAAPPTQPNIVAVPVAAPKASQLYNFDDFEVVPVY